jgi:hypothetical protein
MREGRWRPLRVWILIEFNERSLFVSCHCVVHFGMFGHHQIWVRLLREPCSLPISVFAGFGFHLLVCIFVGLGAASSVLPKSIFLRVFLSPRDSFGFVTGVCRRGEIRSVLAPFFWSAAQARRPRRFQPLLRLRHPCPFCPAVRTQLLAAATVFLLLFDLCARARDSWSPADSQCSFLFRFDFLADFLVPARSAFPLGTRVRMFRSPAHLVSPLLERARPF